MYADALLFVHDSRDQLRQAFDNSSISREDYLTADPAAYGEGWEGMAQHIHDMSNLERIIFEDCEVSDDKVLAPHPNLKPYPHWLCPEYIARKIGCDLHDAANLLDCWVMLDPTQKMVETFISWAKARSIESSLAYFEKLALALAEVENIDPEDATESEDVQYQAPDEYRYHVIGDDAEDETPWLKRQCPWYQALVQSVRNCTDLDQLLALGKATYNLKLLHGMAGVFWTEYNIRKKALTPELHIGPVAQVFINKIAGSNGNLASLGAWLYKVQQGRIRVHNAPKGQEWTPIWAAYAEAKSQHNREEYAARPDVPSC